RCIARVHVARGHRIGRGPAVVDDRGRLCQWIHRDRRRGAGVGTNVRAHAVKDRVPGAAVVADAREPQVDGDPGLAAVPDAGRAGPWRYGDSGSFATTPSSPTVLQSS